MSNGVEKKFLILWKDGSHSVLFGTTLVRALTQNGFGISSLSNMHQYIEDGIDADWTFDIDNDKWIYLGATCRG